MINLFNGKKGQMTIFVIVAIVIVAAILVYLFVFRNTGVKELNVELRPAYDTYLNCIKEQTKNAADLAGSQSGHIELPTYYPGSDYAPFSSQLDFLGFPVPYWYYVSGNGIIREQIPTKTSMEKEIATYVQDRLQYCNFDLLREQGFSVVNDVNSVKVQIEDSKIVTSVNSDFLVSKGEVAGEVGSHEISVDSKLGKFYDIALEIYNKEKNDAFLENYSVDTLRLNAPVDGVELTCGPKIWKAREVDENLRSALEANIAAIKIRTPESGVNNNSRYFYVPLDVEENVNLIYSKSWPTKLEISGGGVDGELMTAEPVGNQPGLGVMGFCYEPYHFVYDLSYPVMIQIYDNEEIFQFPVSVIIDKNMPRKAALTEISEGGDFDFCQYETQDINVNLYDINLNRIDANVSYECFDQTCKLGESKNGTFSGKAPACVNGYIVTKASGYEDKEQLFSSNEETDTDVILDRQYTVDVNLEVGGKPLSGNAVVTFTRNDTTPQTYSLSLPGSSKLKLIEGYYNIGVYVYTNSSITIPGSKTTQCSDVPTTGILGLFGSTSQQCFDIDIPETKVDNALAGGGKSETYFFPADLEKGKLKLIVNAFPAPTSLEQLQYNFEAFDSQDIGIEIG